MKRILKKIFDDHNFEERSVPFLENEDGFFAVNLNENSVNFYLVLFRNEIEEDFLDNKVYDYYYRIKGMKTGYDERMDKNLSMLICLQRENELSDEERRKQIFKIEEDPYFFKKYVFSYTQEQADTLFQLLKKDERDSKYILNHIVNNKEQFIAFKNQPQDNSIYHLSAKLYIKIPFLALNRGSETLVDLAGEIKKEINEKGLMDFTNRLLKIDEIKGVIDVDDILDVFVRGDKE